MENNFDKIDQFILGDLPSQAAAEIEQRISNDKVFAEQVEDRKTVLLYAKLIGQRQRKEELKAMVFDEKKMINETIENRKIENNIPPAKRSSVFKYLAVAASLALFLISIYWLIPNANTQLNPLAEQYFELYEAPSEKSNDKETIQEQAYKAYKNGEFAKAIPKLNQVLDSNFENRLLLGNAYFKNGDFDKALEQFNFLANNKNENNLFSDIGKWYAALTYLQIEKKDEALKLLKELKVGTEYFNKAQKLITEI